MSVLLRNIKTQTTRLQQQRYMSVVASVLKYSEFGDPAKVIEVQQETVADPSNGEVLVKTLGAPINPADINTIQGEFVVTCENCYNGLLCDLILMIKILILIHCRKISREAPVPSGRRK